jgi:hypothetical protein
MARTFFQRAPGGFRTVQGELIRKMQVVLKAGGFLDDIADGVYGGKTQAALQKFQEQKQLPVSGKVDDQTWQNLMGTAAPDLKQRCLQLTADFEGTGFTKCVGNFDGAGLTWGIIGFTLKHGELGAMLKKIRTTHPNVFSDAFGNLENKIVEVLGSSMSAQMTFANSISIGNNKVQIRPEWAAAFAKLGSNEQVQAIQLERTEDFFETAARDVGRFTVKNELGLALCFDIAVQNGGIDQTEGERIRNKITQTPPATQQDLRKIIAKVVAENGNPTFIEDVRKRKLTIATTQGTVHGSKFDLKTWGLDEIAAS